VTGPTGERPPVFLVGFMYSGKTTVGRELARSTGRGFVDTDELVERRAGAGIARIFEAGGEPELRRLEAEVFRSGAIAPEVVVATGGGAFQQHGLRRLMNRSGPTVWLDLPLEIARERRSADPSPRPLWRDDDPVAFRAFFERRRAVYALAASRVDATGAPQAVARTLAELLSGRKI
jgi:shikimate kinase